MEHLPIELIGNILSCLKAARDVVIASTTCKKWHQAFRTHLHSISFDSRDWPAYRGIPTSKLEVLITQTIFQTSNLHSLSIFIDLPRDTFSLARVISWLLYTRKTLRKFHCPALTSSVDILKKCGELEELLFDHSLIFGVEPSYHKFPCLKSLVLIFVSTSSLDLSLLFSACPKIDTFKLITPLIVRRTGKETLELTSSSLKCIYVKSFRWDRFVLEADNLEKLHFKDCSFELFELMGKRSLRVLNLENVCVSNLDFGDNSANLEVLDVSNTNLPRSNFCKMISRSSKLGKLRLWGVVKDNGDEVLNLDTLPACLPHLTHLSLNYDLKDPGARKDLNYSYQVNRHGFHDSYQFKNVVVLELGRNAISDLFTDWVAVLLARCPNLRKLVIHETVSKAGTQDDWKKSMVRLVREYDKIIEVRFVGFISNKSSDIILHI